MTATPESARTIAQKSRTFLIDTFTDLRDDLENRVREGGPGGPDPEKAASDLAIYEVLLAGLSQREAFPDNEAIREYVAGLAKAIDEVNGYEQATLEHRAFAELVGALGEKAAPLERIPPLKRFKDRQRARQHQTERRKRKEPEGE